MIMDSLIIVFVCHDNESILNVLSYGYPILFVGNKPIAEEYASNKNIYILRDLEYNIESEAKLLTFTAWYGIIKNNLFINYKYICILEYDVSFDNNFINNLNNLCSVNKNDVISFINGDRESLYYSINKLVLQYFLNINNIKININNPIKWAPTTNHCIRREILSDFVDFYYSAYLEIKKNDINGLSWYHERVFSLYLNHKNIEYFVLSGLYHFGNNSHHILNNNIIPKKNKKYFLVYDDGTHTTYVDKLIASVKQYSDFIVIIYKKSDIDSDFMTNNKKILNENRGGGYWLWKPYIINKILSKIDDEDYLFYLDSKYYFLENFNSLYENIMKNNDIILWSNKPNENTNQMKNYCKMDVINKYGIEEIVFNNNAIECWAGAIFLKKLPYIEKLMKEWLTMCCVYEDISDVNSVLPNYEYFNGHRHDQSLLSVLVHKYNINLHFFENKYLQNVRYPWWYTNMDKIIEFNRNTLNNVSNWIKKEDWESPPSLYNYGLPSSVFHLINKNISNELTECDLLCYFMVMFNDKNIPINYLEIGASVGKTFFQIAKFVKYNIVNNIKYSLNCLDIEKINPILKELLLSLPYDSLEETKLIPNISIQESFIIQKNENSIMKIIHGNNDIKYFESNEFDIDIWKHMSNKYNIIFSDALHEPFALLNEYYQLKINNLIDYENFIYCFDDLESEQTGGMWQAANSISNDLKCITNNQIYIKHYKVNGWLGNNEYIHNFGVITNINFNNQLDL